MRVASWVIGRRVERIEAMVLVFNLRTVRDHKPDLAKDPDDILGDLRQRMKFAYPSAAPRQGEICFLFWQRCF